jgi:hypothetical protein
MTKAGLDRLSGNIVAHGPLTVNGRRFLFLDSVSSSQGEPMQPTLRDDVQLIRQQIHPACPSTNLLAFLAIHHPDDACLMLALTRCTPTSLRDGAVCFL